MNKIYRVIYNKSTQTFQAVTEYAKAQGKSSAGTVGSTSNPLRLVARLTAVALGVLLVTDPAFAVRYWSLQDRSGNDGSQNNTYTQHATTVVIGNNAGVVQAYPGDNNRNPDVVVIGNQAAAVAGLEGSNGSKSVAIGAHSQAAESSTAVGWTARARHSLDVAIGRNATSDAQASMAIGWNATTAEKANRSLALGVDARANKDSDMSSAIGVGANTWGQSTIAIGTNAKAGLASNYVGSSKAVAIGSNANATGFESYALGTSAHSTGDYSFAQGSNSKAQGKSSFALGYNATSVGERSIAMVFDSYAGAESDIAIGYKAKATGNHSLAMVANSTASGARSIAIGVGSNASGSQSIAIGVGNQVSGNNAGAFGDPNTVSGNNSYAFGNDNTVSTENTFVMGNNITTTVANSVVLGNKAATVASGTSTKAMDNYATDTVAGQTVNFAGGAPTGLVSVGSATETRRIQGVSAGLISANSTDAINGSQLYAVADGLKTYIDSRPTGTGTGTASNNYFHVNPDENPAAASGSDNNAAVDGIGNATGGKALAAGFGATASGKASIAIGDKANADNLGGIAIGQGAVSATVDKNASADAAQALSGVNKAIAIGNAAQATHSKTVAIGDAAAASGLNAVAIGSQTKSTGTESTVVGSAAEAHAAFSVAIGQRANVTASGFAATAIGNLATASGGESVALGRHANSSASQANAIGYNATASGEFGVAMGTRTNATAAHSVAISTDANASANQAIAIGRGSQSQGGSSVALGHDAKVTGTGSTNSVAIGQGASVTAASATAVGRGATATSTNAFAGGREAAATGASSVALGSSAKAAGNNAFAGALNANAAGASSVAIGNNANTVKDNAIALGTTANANGTGAISMGNIARTTADHAIAVGTNANATGIAAMALGQNAEANLANSVALGQGATTTAATQTTGATVNGVSYGLVNGVGTSFAGANVDTNYVVSVGKAGAERQIQNVAAGRISSTSTDAINGSQLYMVADQLAGGWAIANATDKVGDVKIGQGNQVKFVGEGNTAVTVEGTNGQYTVKISSVGATGTGTGTAPNNYFHVNPSATATAAAGTNNEAPVDGIGGATGGYALAAGFNAKAGGDLSVAIGKDAATDTSGAIAIGDGATAVVSGTTLADGSKATGGIAIGTGSRSNHQDTIAMGTEASSTNLNATAIGTKASATVEDTTAIGAGSLSSGPRSIALSKEAKATGGESIALGYQAEAKSFGTALGSKSKTEDNYALAVGYESQAIGQQSTAVGYKANTTKEAISGIAVGQEASAQEDHAMAMGYQAVASGERATAIGDTARASAVDAIAQGSSAQAIATNAIATGKSAIASEENAMAQGTGAKAFKADAIAQGTNAQAVGDSAVAIGKDSYVGSATHTPQQIQDITDAYNNALSEQTTLNTRREEILNRTDELSAERTRLIRQRPAAPREQIAAIDAQIRALDTELEEINTKVDAADEAVKTTKVAFDAVQGAGVKGIAIGDAAKVYAENGVALGAGAIVADGLANAVALGANSVVTAVTAAPDATINGVTYGNFAGNNPSAGDVVSVGSAGKERRIQNVAAGRITADSTDAINGSQLYAVVTTGSWQLQSGGNKVGDVNWGDKVNFTSADKSVTITPTMEKDGVSVLDFKVNADGTTIKVDPNTGVVTANTTELPDANTDGKIDAPTNGASLVNATTVANAINNSGFTAKAAATADGKDNTAAPVKDTGTVVNPGETVTFEADKNLEVTQTVETNGDTKFSFKTKDDVTFNSVTSNTVKVPTGTTPTDKPITINNNGMDMADKPITNVAGNLDGAKDGTTAPTTVSTSTPTGDTLNNAATVGDVLNAGWNLKHSDGTTTTDKDFVRHADNVVFANGVATTASVETDGTTSTIKFDVKTDGTTIKVDDAGNITANTGDLTNNATTGVVNTPNTEDGKKLTTAADVAEAINNSGFRVKSAGTNKAEGDEAAERLVKTGELVEFEAGDNLTVKRVGDTFTYATKQDVTFNSVTSNTVKVPTDATNPANNPITISSAGVDMADKPITNINNGLTNAPNNLRDLGNTNVADSTAATVGDLRNMGWVVSSNKTTGTAEGQPTDAAFSQNVKNANEVQFVGTGIAKVSGDVKDGKNVITVHVDEIEVPNPQTSNITADATSGQIGVKNGDNTVDTNPTENPNNLVTANDVVNAVNNAFWKVFETDATDGNKKDDVKAGDNVVFAKGDGTTVSVTNTDDKTTTVKYSIDKGDIQVNEATGAVSTTDADNKVATTTDVAGAISKSGFKLTATKSTGDVEGVSEELINPSDTVTIDAGDNIKLTQDKGKITVATKKDVTFDNVTSNTIKVPTDNTNPNSNPITIDNTGIDMADKPITNVAGNLDGAKKDTTAPTTVSTSTPAGDTLNNAATVGDVLNAGWNLKHSDGTTTTDKDFVRHADNVVFANGVATTASVETDGTTSTIKFDVKTDGTTIKVDDAGNITANTANLGNNATDGKVTVPTGDENKLTTANDVAEAINNSGFRVKSAGNNKAEGDEAAERLVKTGELVEFEAGDNLTVKRVGDKFTYATAKEVQFDKVTVGGDTNPITITSTPSTTVGGNPTNTISNLTGNLAPTTNNADGDLINKDGTDGKTEDSKPTTSQTAPTNAQAINNNAATVGDVLNAGWNLQGNGEAKDFVKPYDTVNFVDGKGTKAVVESNGTTSTIKVDIDNGTITANNNGSVTGPVSTQLQDDLKKAQDELAALPDTATEEEKKAAQDKVDAAQNAVDNAGGNQVATAQNVADAINKSGFNLKTSATAEGAKEAGTANDGELINPSDTVEMVAGKNLTVKQDADGKVTYATKEEVDFNKVTVSSQAPVYTNQAGDELVKQGDKYFTKDGNVEVPANEVITTNPNAVNLTTKEGTAVNNAGTAQTTANKPNELNIAGDNNSLTQITGVGSTLNTTPVDVAPQGDKTEQVDGKAPTSNLVDLANAANPTSAATVGDLQNMGWVVSASGNEYKDTVKNANQVNFVGTGLATVTGETKDGVRTITVDVDAQKVVETAQNPVVYTNAEGDKLTKVGDQFYKVDDVVNGVPKPDATEVKPADVIASMNNGSNSTTVTPMTLANIASNLAPTTSNADGDLINKDGTDGKTEDSKPTTSQTAPTNAQAINNNAATVGDVLNAGWNLQGNGEAKDFVKPYDTVNFVDGKGTKAVVESNGTTSTIKVDIDNGTITANNNGSVTGPVTDALKKAVDDAKKALDADPNNQALKDDLAKAEQNLTNAGNQVATAQNVADAINASGFNLKTSATAEGVKEAGTADDGELINPSDTVEMIAGKNLTVKQDANGKVTYATKEEVDFNNVTISNGDNLVDGEGNKVTAEKDPVTGDTVYKNEAGDIINANEVKPANTVNLVNEAGTKVTNAGTGQNANKPAPSALNITGTDAAGNASPTQITGVASTLNTKAVDTAPTGTGSQGSDNLVDLKGDENNPVNPTSAATVGDLQNMGWVVSASGNEYKDTVKNANQVNFVGTGLATVTGETKDGVRTITVDVDAQKVVETAQNPVVYTNAEGDKLTKVGDQFYKVDDVVNGVPKPDATEVKPADVIASMNNGSNSTTVTPMTLANIASNLAPTTSNADGDLINKDGTDGKTEDSKPTTSQTAPTNAQAINNNAATVGDVLNAGWNLQGNGEAKDFVKPYDTVNFVDGKGTKAVVESNGTTSTIKVDIDNGTITANNNGSVTGPVTDALKKAVDDAKKALDADPNNQALKDDLAKAEQNLTNAGNQVATAQNVADAINASGFNLKTSATAEGVKEAGTADDGELINPSDTVEMIAGKNLTVKQDANGKVTYATKEEVDFNNVTISNGDNLVDGEGNKVTAEKDPVTGDTVYKNEAGDIINANEVKPANTVNLVNEAGTKVTNAGTGQNANKPAPSALNITGTDAAGNASPTQITGVASTLNTKAVDTAPTGTGSQGSDNLVDLKGDENNPVNPTSAATVGDLQNMGWVVSASGNEYKDTVKNANQVNFVGTGLATVTGETKDGVRTITVDVDAQKVVETAQNPVVYTNAEGDKLTKVGDQFYKVDDVVNGVPKPDATEVKPADVIASMNNGSNSTTVTPMTLANIASNLAPTTSNADGDLINKDGTDGKTEDSKPTTSQTAPTNAQAINNNAATVGDVLNAGWNLQGNGEAKDFVKPYDTVNFVDGKGTKAVVESNGTTSTIKVDIDNGTITANNNGSVTGPVTDALKKAVDDAKKALDADPNNQALKDDLAKAEQNLTNAGNQVATAQNVADAINASGFNLKTSATAEGVKEAGTADDGELINPSDTVEMIAGKNLTVKQDANGKVTYATKEEVDFNNVTISNGDNLVDGEGNKVTAEKDPVTGDTVYKNEAGDIINANEVKPANTVNLVNEAGTKVTNAGTGQNANKPAPSALNITGTDAAGNASPTQITGVASTLNTKAVDTAPTGTGSQGSDNLVDLKGDENNPVNPTSAATVGDLQNMGWVVSASGNEYKDTVKNANQVNFVGTGLATVTGETKDGVRTITVDVDAQKVVETAQNPVVYTNAEGDKLTKVGDQFYKVDDVVNGVPKPDATEVKPADVIASMNNGSNSTTVTPMTLANIASNLAPTTSNADGDLINKDGTDGKTEDSKPTTSQTAPTNAQAINNNAATVGDVLNAGWNLQGNGEAKDFVKPYDTVNFVDGKGTKAVVESNGTTSTIKVDIDNGTITANNNGSVTGPVTDALKKAVDDAKKALDADPNNQALKDDLAKAEQNLTNAGNQVATAQNVADAINGSGWNLAAEGTDGEELINPSDKVTFKAGDNLEVKRDGAQITYALQKDINVNSVTAGDTKVDNDGITINNGTAGNPVSLTKNGLDNGGNRITNVAPGVNPTDAVNVSQLKGLADQVTNVAGDANAGVSSAMAMAALPQAYLPGKSMLTGGVASYNGEGAVAVGFSKLSDNGRWVMKMSGSADTQGNVGGAVGAGFHF